MITLALDTATEIACVAIVRDGEVLAESSRRAPRSQTEELIPLVDEVLAVAGIAIGDVDEVVVGVGPGPFTGLRVGIVTGVMLAQGLGIPASGVISLDACAAVHLAAAPAIEPFVITIDAKRGEVFWARYGTDGTRLDGPFVGKDVSGVPGLMSAAALTQCASRVTPTPVYLREPDVTMPGAPKRVTP